MTGEVKRRTGRPRATGKTTNILAVQVPPWAAEEFDRVQAERGLSTRTDLLRAFLGVPGQSDPRYHDPSETDRARFRAWLLARSFDVIPPAEVRAA